MVSDEVVFLAETLQAAGYATAAFSGNPNASPVFGMDQGFDHFYFPGNELARDYPDIKELIKEAEAWLRALPRGQPHFLYLHIMNVHGPYTAPSNYPERFRTETSTPFEFQNEIWADIMRKGELARRDEVTPQHLVDLKARYDGAVAYTDEVLGAFLQQLRGRGLLHDSHVIITSDHGEELFDHGGFGHGWTLLPEVTHVPLIWRRPQGESGGHRVPSLVSLLDIPATLIHELGLQDSTADAFVDGVNLGPALRGEEFDRGAPVLLELRREKQGVALGLVHQHSLWMETQSSYENKDPEQYLFDLKSDPQASSNRMDSDGDRARRMAEIARQWQKELESNAFYGTAAQLDPALLEQLEALGYMTD